jgi:hypothetical protein
MRVAVVEIGKKSSTHTVTVLDSIDSNILSSVTHDLPSTASFVVDGSITATSHDEEVLEEVAMRPEFCIGPGASTASKKKARATSKEVQRKHSIKASHDLRNKLAMKQATVLIKRNRDLPAGHRLKTSIVKIVNETNNRLNANVSAKTAAQYMRLNLVGVSPLRRGPTGDCRQERSAKARQHSAVRRKLACTEYCIESHESNH